ncbi:tetratricopeptide repeat protein [Candidatus Nitronereus thalassa]|uniref:Tetratricopeptide repeat protein n=1 Tax=Candidatus Nitronereus thalassa TaxID=3020898 RepID=A0ABU3K525_9BACT|nr:tetratricopeptide repeat protein [Candidatus Nitronereus thalassa]MDT7041509.1 tetratricopeptide repeat protein [Candidatus Nitronereus thalassa]
MNRAERRRQGRLSAKAGIRKDPKPVAQWLKEARSHHREGRFKQAEALYRQVLEENSTHPDALHLLGLATYQQGEYGLARTLIEDAIRHNKKTPLYHYNLGLACEKLGNLEDAVQAYHQAIHLKPNYVEARSNLGNVYREQGNLDAAVSTFEQVIQIQPDYAGGFNNLGVALKEKHDLDGAIDAYQQALRVNPHNAESHNNIGMVYAERGQCESAITEFQKAIEINPGYAKAHQNLGLMQLCQGQRDNALKQFRKSADLIQNHGHSVRLTHVYPSRIKHDAEQLDYLHRQGISLSTKESYSEMLQVLKQHVVSDEEGNHPFAVSASQAETLAPSFNRILHFAESPAIPNGALNPHLDREDIQRRYQKSHPEIICIDELLRPEALTSLRRFCLESTIWKKDYVEGYVGAMLGDGFSSPLLLQVAEELRQEFPGIFHNHPLLQAWAFKQDSQRRPLNIHADAAAVNVNFWITPNEANLDLSCGGLTVWDKEPPKDWDFKIYNNTKYKPKIMEFLQSSGARPVTVPYRENRALIFNSDLFHESDTCHFRDDYESRRINITFLYGHRA